VISSRKVEVVKGYLVLRCEDASADEMVEQTVVGVTTFISMSGINSAIHLRNIMVIPEFFAPWSKVICLQ